MPRWVSPSRRLSPESPKLATPSLASEGSSAATNAVAEPKEVTPSKQWRRGDKRTGHGWEDMVI